ncbi:hypothetical protein BC826DRAFT_33233 [Russula brevipes]|nr:hypothetical protein BC826DRAFT_33233 [Russula brevipes]
MFALGHLLWKQGVIWLLLATVAEVPPTMFVFLNLNDPLNSNKGQRRTRIYLRSMLRILWCSK